MNSPAPSPVRKFKLQDQVRVIRDPFNMGDVLEESLVGKLGRVSLVHKWARGYRIILDEDANEYHDETGEPFEFEVDEDDIAHINGLKRFMDML